MILGFENKHMYVTFRPCLESPVGVEVEFEVRIWRLLLGKMSVVISQSYSKPGENCKIPVAV
jgi:hypothetical protein